MIMVPNKNLLNYPEGSTSSEFIYFYTKRILLLRKVNFFDENLSASIFMHVLGTTHRFRKQPSIVSWFQNTWYNYRFKEKNQCYLMFI